MLVSVLQTLADLLVGGTSLTGTEQIDFSRPGSRRDEGNGPLLNLYFYDIRESKQVQHSGRQVERLAAGSKPHIAKINWSPHWFDVSLLITAWDRTVLSESHLLAEALSVLLRHRSLQDPCLESELQSCGNLSLSVTMAPPLDIGALWSALSLPLRPALYVTVTVPFTAASTVTPRVWERIIKLRSDWNDSDDAQQSRHRIGVAGMVRSAVTAQPLTDTTITLLNTDQHTLSNPEGLFYFEDLHPGNYILQAHHPGYVSRNCTILVDEENATFKEILLVPAS